MLVGISIKEVVLDVVPVSVKDVMDQPASVKKTRDAVLYNYKLEAKFKTLYCCIQLYRIT